MPVGSEQDRDEMQRNEDPMLEEIRLLFERYRETARHATEAAEHDESTDDARALTLR